MASLPECLSELLQEDYTYSVTLQPGCKPNKPDYNDEHYILTVYYITAAAGAKTKKDMKIQSIRDISNEPLSCGTPYQDIERDPRSYHSQEIPTEVCKEVLRLQSIREVQKVYECLKENPPSAGL